MDEICTLDIFRFSNLEILAKMEQEMATKMEQVAFSHKIGASFFLWMPPKNVFLSVFRPLNWGSTKKKSLFCYINWGERGEGSKQVGSCFNEWNECGISCWIGAFLQRGANCKTKKNVQSFLANFWNNILYSIIQPAAAAKV